MYKSHIDPWRQSQEDQNNIEGWDVWSFTILTLFFFPSEDYTLNKFQLNKGNAFTMPENNIIMVLFMPLNTQYY